MLTPHLKTVIDEKWDNCWPVSNLRPIAILDLTGYIFFLKKLDDEDLISKNLSSLKSGHFIFSREIEEFTWTRFKDMDSQAIHDLFTKQFGILDLMNEYGQSGFLYSRFFQTPLRLKPTSKLLLNVIQLVNLIESSDATTQAAVIEYLFNKAQTANKETQFIPEYISRLMVAISEPTVNDVICDISTGNATLLVNAAGYIESNTSVLKDGVAPAFTGFESNVNLLRMAGMRMMLHGISDPDVQILSPVEINFSEKPTLFISNLLQRNEERAIATENTDVAINMPTEIILLDHILRNLQTNSRAVVFVSENLLKSFLPAIEHIRKEIVDNTNLEGVIHLPANSNSFSAAGLLIFNKHESETTKQVWFCKMEKPKKKRTLNETITNPNQNEILVAEELSRANVVLDQWKNRKEISNQNCFFISAYDIKANNYNLNFNDYKLMRPIEPADDAQLKNDELPVNGIPVVAKKNENLHHFYEGPAPLEKRRRRRKHFPAILLLLVVGLSCGASYLYYFKGNSNGYQQSAVVSDSIKTGSVKPVETSSKTETEKIKKNTAVKIAAFAHSKTTIADDSSKRYTVVNKAWFHSAPDSAARKGFYLQPRQDLVLEPTVEENGFVYVVYINKKGQPTRGWLAKKDLEPVD